jgi:hypothetical protein
VRGKIVGRTAIGRATVTVLGMNAAKLVEIREALTESGSLKPVE